MAHGPDIKVRLDCSDLLARAENLSRIVVYEGQ